MAIAEGRVGASLATALGTQWWAAQKWPRRCGFPWICSRWQRAVGAKDPHGAEQCRDAWRALGIQQNEALVCPCPCGQALWVGAGGICFPRLPAIRNYWAAMKWEEIFHYRHMRFNFTWWKLQYQLSALPPLLSSRCLCLIPAAEGDAEHPTPPRCKEGDSTCALGTCQKHSSNPKAEKAQ